MKIFLSAIIVLVSGICGIVYADKYRKNYIFLADLVYIFNVFKIKIAFFKNEISNVMQESLTNIKSKTKFFDGLIETLKTSSLSEEKIVNNIDVNISQEEKQMIARYIVGISCSYETDELNDYISQGQNYCLERQNYYQTKDKTEGSLIKKLSISAGLVLSILLY